MKLRQRVVGIACLEAEEMTGRIERDAIEAIFLRVLLKEFLLLDLNKMIFIMKFMKKCTSESSLHIPHALYRESLL